MHDMSVDDDFWYRLDQLLERALILRERFVTLDADAGKALARRDTAGLSGVIQVEHSAIAEFLAIIDEATRLRKQLIDSRGPKA